MASPLSHAVQGAKSPVCVAAQCQQLPGLFMTLDRVTVEGFLSVSSFEQSPRSGKSELNLWDLRGSD